MKNNRDLKRCLPYLLSALCVLVLFFAFYKNSFRAADPEWFSTYQEDSDLNVTGRIERTIQTGSAFSDHGFLGYPIENGAYYSYFRQIGLQGMYASLMQRFTGADLNDTIRYVRAFHSLALAVLLTVFLWWVWREFSASHAAAAFAVTLYSPWLTVSARNLYWATWLMFLPFILFLPLLRFYEKNGKYSHTVVFSAALVTVFLKSACGYEFISSILIAAALPFLYYAVKNKWKIKIFLRRVFWVGLGGVSGFAAALLLNLYQCTRMLNSLTQSLTLMMDNVSKRTGFFGIEQADSIIRESLTVNPLLVINTYLTQNEPVLFGFTASDLLILFLFSLIAALLPPVRRMAGALYVTAAVSITAPVSWFILAKGHSYIHTHINYILWSVPVLYFIALSIFDTAKKMCVQAYRACRGPARRLVVVLVPIVLGVYILLSFYLRGYVRAW